MIKVLFFARLREELGCAGLDLDRADELADLDSLAAYLVREYGERYRQVLDQPNIVRAVNQNVVDGNVSLSDGDEVAFFPPVTGG